MEMPSDGVQPSVRQRARTVMPGDIVLLGREHTRAGGRGEARLCRIVAKSVRSVKNTNQYRVSLEGEDIFSGHTHKCNYSSVGSLGVIVPTIVEVTMLLRSMDHGRLVAIDSSGETVTDLTVPSASLHQELIQAHEAGEELSLCVKCYMGEKAVFDYVGENEHVLAQPTE